MPVCWSVGGRSGEWDSCARRVLGKRRDRAWLRGLRFQLPGLTDTTLFLVMYLR